MILLRMEKACSRFIGKLVFSLDALWSNDRVVFFILFSLLLIVFFYFMILRKRGNSRVVPFFGFFLTLVLTGNGSVAHAMGDPGDAGPSGSTAGNQAGASTPSSSFFGGLSGQIPAAPDSPGEEVQQMNIPPFDPYATPEVPQEHLFAAVPERGTAVSGVEGPSCSYVKERIAQFLSSYGRTPRNRVDHVRRLVTELQLDSSDQEDRLKMCYLINTIGTENSEREKGEAGGLLVEAYAEYYKSKYGESIYIKRSK